jgi:hypothetical protein
MGNYAPTLNPVKAVGEFLTVFTNICIPDFATVLVGDGASSAGGRRSIFALHCLAARQVETMPKAEFTKLNTLEACGTLTWSESQEPTIA